jgi:HNH endonuclease
MSPTKKPPDQTKLDRLVLDARRKRELREQDYRAQALKLYPWICGRCSREFTRENLRELTVHHRNHDHDCNPSDGSNWELLCVYCHEQEHVRLVEAAQGLNSTGSRTHEPPVATSNPFAGLSDLLKRKD